MILVTDIERIHLVERMAFVLRGRCNPCSSDRDKIIALCFAGFKFEDIAEHFTAAERRARLQPNRGTECASRRAFSET